MVRQSTRGDASGQRPPRSQPANRMELPTAPLNSGAAVWWGSTGPAASSSEVASTDMEASRAVQAEFPDPQNCRGKFVLAAKKFILAAMPFIYTCKGIDSSINEEPRSKNLIEYQHALGRDPRPPGGFLNYLDNASPFPFPQQLPQQMSMPLPPNFQFSRGAAPTQYPTVSLPSISKGNPPSTIIESSTPHVPSSSHTDQVIDVNTGNEDSGAGNEDEEIRTSKRLIWTKEEDLRLMSAWINNSTDPIKWTNRKNEQYWNDVAVYNSTTPKSRWRLAKQAKDRWHKQPRFPTWQRRKIGRQKNMRWSVKYGKHIERCLLKILVGCQKV
ncbi:hypothetical protein ACP4OV_013203 [Aristida adscensionis]